MRRLAVLAAAAALALTGCSDPVDEPEVEDEIASPDDGGQTAEAPSDTATDPGAAPGGGPVPERGECIDLPPTDEHVWTVADAGVVTAGDEEGVLSAGVEPAAGWEYEIESEDDDEVDVVFRREGQVLRLELESDDDGIEADLCAGV